MPITTQSAPITITAEETLNALIERLPQTLPALRYLGLDACCGGALPLRTAAQHHGLDVEQVIIALHSAIEGEAR